MIYNTLDKISSRRKADKTYRIENAIEEQLKASGRKSALPVINLSTEDVETPIHIAGLYTLLGFNPKTDADIADQLPVNLMIEGEPLRRGLEVYRPLLKLTGGYDRLIEIARKCGITNPFDYVKEVYGKFEGDCNILSFDESGKKLFTDNQEGFFKIMTEILSPFFSLGKNDQIKYLRELQTIKKSNKPSILIVGASASELENLCQTCSGILEMLRSKGKSKINF